MPWVSYSLLKDLCQQLLSSSLTEEERLRPRGGGEGVTRSIMKKDDRFLRLAIAAAKEAGRIQIVHYGQSHRIEYKGAIDPVTEVDKLCEKAMIKMISDAFPDHDILSEESHFMAKGSSWKWIIDPIDGTSNYIHQYPCFCSSIGLEVDGEVEVGVVYNPLLDELFHTEKGVGAFLNGRRITVSRKDELEGSFLCTGFPYDVREHSPFYLKYFEAFITRSFALRRPGSAVLDLCYVAAGRFDGFWEMKLHPWDSAAASLMVTEAGGRVTDFKGNPYSDETLASNGLIHDQMLQVIREADTKTSKPFPIR
jgi:myo-inositol-1(or 4)-monophosphatase